MHIKLYVAICLSAASIYMTWRFRQSAKRWVAIINERITPLVWLFGLILLLTVPVVAYNAWQKDPGRLMTAQTDRKASDDKSRPNIIMVTFDAMAAREMSVYGYQRNTTPFISWWSDKAFLFSNVKSASNFTTPAVASLLTGKRVWTHQTYHIEGAKPARGNLESLPFVLKENGYFNLAFVVNPFASVRVLGMADSFDIAPLTSEFGEPASLFGWKFGTIDVLLYRAFGDRIRLHNWILRNDFILSKVINLFSRNINQTTVPPEKAFNRFLEIVDNNIPKPFFAWIHLFPPHDPYLPPEPFKGVYSSSTELRSYKSQEKLIEESYKYLFTYQSVPEEMMPSVKLMRNYYDELIRYCDNKFGEFIEKLNNRKIDNTIIILSSDHGESFDHGYFTHGGPFLYEQVEHIPLIIKEPGQSVGQVINDRVEQVDIAATIIDLANVQAPSWLEGRSLRPLMRGDRLPMRPAFAMNLQENRSLDHRISKGSIAVWEGDYKLIYYLGREKSLLFDLKKDPHELINLMEAEPEIGRNLMDLILENLQKINKVRSEIK